MTGLVTLLRPSADLAWLRLRIRVKSGTAAQRLVAARLLRAAVPELPVDGLPLHARLTTLGALLTVSADGHGIAVYVTVVPERLAAATDLIRAALQTPPPAELARAAADEVVAVWEWMSADSESTADLIADLTLHTAPPSWPELYREMAQAMSAVSPSFPGLGPATATLVSPFVPDAAVERAIAGLTEGAHAVVATAEEPVATTPATLRLDVASEASALVRLGWRTPPRTHPDFPSLAVAARILGGHYRSLLMRTFRQERGWSYSPWAMLRSGPERGLWQVSVRVPADRVDEATARVRELVTECRPTPAECAVAVAHTVAEQRTLWSSGESRLTLSGYWQDLGLQPEAERRDWPRRVGEVFADRLHGVMRTHLCRPPDLTMILT